MTRPKHSRSKQMEHSGVGQSDEAIALSDGGAGEETFVLAAGLGYCVVEDQPDGISAKSDSNLETKCEVDNGVTSDCTAG